MVYKVLRDASPAYFGGQKRIKAGHQVYSQTQTQVTVCSEAIQFLHTCSIGNISQETVISFDVPKNSMRISLKNNRNFKDTILYVRSRLNTTSFYISLQFRSIVLLVSDTGWTGPEPDMHLFFQPPKQKIIRKEGMHWAEDPNRRKAVYYDFIRRILKTGNPK